MSPIFYMAARWSTGYQFACYMAKQPDTLQKYLNENPKIWWRTFFSSHSKNWRVRQDEFLPKIDLAKKPWLVGKKLVIISFCHQAVRSSVRSICRVACQDAHGNPTQKTMVAVLQLTWRSGGFHRFPKTIIAISDVPMLVIWLYMDLKWGYP